MLQLKAYSAFVDLSKSIRVYYVLAAGIFVSAISFFLFRDILLSLVVIACAITGTYLLSRPPKEIVVTLDEERIDIDGMILDWKKCRDWAVIDLGDVWEFVVRTDQYVGQYYYFYSLETDPESQKFVNSLTSLLDYNEDMPKKNIYHVFLRRFGLK